MSGDISGDVIDHDASPNVIANSSTVGANPSPVNAGPPVIVGVLLVSPVCVAAGSASMAVSCPDRINAW